MKTVNRLSAEETKMKLFIFTICLLLVQLASAQSLKQSISFTQNWSRYPAPDAMIATLMQQFPHGDLKTADAACYAVTMSNQSQLGESSPFTGAPAIKEPNSAFIVWYTGCVRNFLLGENSAFRNAYNSASDAAKESIVLEFAGPKLKALCPLPQTAESYADPYSKTCDWQHLPLKSRIDAIAETIETLLGPDDVLRDQGLASSSTALAQRIDSQLNVIFKDKPDAFLFLNLRLGAGANPTPLQMIAPIQFLILLNDTLKY
jgi:hypothetical protein